MKYSSGASIGRAPEFFVSDALGSVFIDICFLNIYSA